MLSNSSARTVSDVTSNWPSTRTSPQRRAPGGVPALQRLLAIRITERGLEGLLRPERFPNSFTEASEYAQM